MAAKQKGYFPPPGAQQPQKYPRVGPNYLQYGEQPGWTYSPRDDKYYRDQQSREQLEQYEIDQGLRSPPPKEPKQPGLADIVLPVGATAGAMAIGQGLGSSLTSGSGLLSTLGTIGKTGTAAQLGGAAAGTTAGAGAAATGGAAAGSTGLAAPTVIGASKVPMAAAPAGLASGYGIGLGPLAAVGGATFLGGRSAVNMLQGKEDKSIPGMIGRGSLAIATGGLSEVARPFFNRETTRDRARKNTAQLLDQAKGDPVAEAYVQGMRQQYDSAPPDPSKPFAGKYASWEEYQKAGLEAPDLTGVYGNLKTYGNEWAKLTQEQRVAVTQLNINDGIYKSKKGEVEITDQEKAKKNLQAVMGGAVPTPAKPIMGGAAGPAPLPPGTTPQQVAATPSQGLQSINPGITPPNQTGLLAAVPAGVSSQVQNLRTNTRSPGIDKQGRRIRY